MISLADAQLKTKILAGAACFTKNVQNHRKQSFTKQKQTNGPNAACIKSKAFPDM